jgi:hypothetical protein
MMMLPKDEEPIGINNGVLKVSSSTSFASRLISYLVDEMNL